MSTEPNWASPPGATIARVLKSREIDPAEFADAVGLKAREFEALLHGKIRVSEKLAEALADQLGSTARFWLARDKDYMKELARLGDADIMGADQWAQSMPVVSMRRFGWLPADSRAKAIRNKALLILRLQKPPGVGSALFRRRWSGRLSDIARIRIGWYGNARPSTHYRVARF